MNKIFCLLHILKERSSYMNKALRLFVVFLQEIESNGGCCLTHVNMRCLGDFAENELAASGLWADVSGGEKKKKQIGIGTWSDNLAVFLHPVLNMSAVNWVQPYMGIRWGDWFIYLFIYFFGLFFSSLRFWLACRFVDVSRSSKILLPLDLERSIFWQLIGDRTFAPLHSFQKKLNCKYACADGCTSKNTHTHTYTHTLDKFKTNMT